MKVIIIARVVSILKCDIYSNLISAELDDKEMDEGVYQIQIYVNGIT